jgi:hypothetical protein
MITDANLQVSSAQAVTVTAPSTNTIDLTVARDVGEGSKLFADFSVPTACTAAGAATVTLQVIASAAANLSAPVIIGSSDAIPVASLVAGYTAAVAINPQLKSLGLRYLGVNYVVATGPLTAGAFTCDINVGVQDNKNYASGFAVS